MMGKFIFQKKVIGQKDCNFNFVGNFYNYHIQIQDRQIRG